MCRVLGVSRSGYYAWRARQDQPVPQRQSQDRMLLVEIKASHEASRQTYGAPRVLDDLRQAGHRVSRKRVARLMRQAGLRATRPRRYVSTTDSRHGLPVAQNVLDRDFSATARDQKWACDITYVPTDQGWLYLAVVLDLYSRRIVGHSMSARLERGLVIEAFSMAWARRAPQPGLLHHSDQGSQYASDDYQGLLSGAACIASMSRRGNCWDNAPVESFFATLKRELVHRCRYRTRSAARASLFEYIEVFYNARRKHSSLGYLSPVAFEQKHRRSMALGA